jgi:hypothetical protein
VCLVPDGDGDDCVFEYDLRLEVASLVVEKQVLDLLQEVNSSYPGSYAGVGLETVGPHLRG